MNILWYIQQVVSISYEPAWSMQNMWYGVVESLEIIEHYSFYRFWVCYSAAMASERHNKRKHSVWEIVWTQQIQVSAYTCCLYRLQSKISYTTGARSSVVGWVSVLQAARSQAWDPMKSMNFFNLPNTFSCTRPWGLPSLVPEGEKKSFGGVECCQRVRLTTSLLSVSHLSRQCGILNVSLLSVRGWVNPRATVKLERLGKLRNSVISSGINLQPSGLYHSASTNYTFVCPLEFWNSGTYWYVNFWS
jgi:hypothetical protein